jgi:hypothetical protein
MTWADILAPSFDHFENWGQSGAGNQYIFNSVMEADQRRRFRSGDTVMICWTNIMRDDWYAQRHWVTPGGIWDTPIYTKEFIADHVNPRGYLIRDLAYIKATQSLLDLWPEVRWYMFSMCPMDAHDIWDESDVKLRDCCDLYQPVLDRLLPSFQQVLRPNGWGYGHKPGDDDHPTPQEHLAYLDSVFPGWVTDTEWRAKIAQEPAVKSKYRSGMCQQARL